MFRRLFLGLMSLLLNVADPAGADADADDDGAGDDARTPPVVAAHVAVPAPAGRGDARRLVRPAAAVTAVAPCAADDGPRAQGAEAGTPVAIYPAAAPAGAWVVDDDAARVAEPFVGVIGVDPSTHATGMASALRAALAACRERGDLKVRIIAATDDAAAAAALLQTCESQGFMFARRRAAVAGGQALEFYTDLYFDPTPRAPGESWAD